MFSSTIFRDRNIWEKLLYNKNNDMIFCKQIFFESTNFGRQILSTVQKRPHMSQVKIISFNTCPSGDCFAVRWGWSFSISSVGYLGLIQGRLVVCCVLLPSQRSSDHHEGVLPRWATSTFAALREPLPTQIEDLTKSEEYAHKAGHHHEDGEDFLLCGPEGYMVKDERHNVSFSSEGKRSSSAVKGRGGDSGERLLTVEFHFQVVKYQRFGIEFGADYQIKAPVFDHLSPE